MSEDRYRQIGEAIGTYEKVVKSAIGDLLKEAVVDLLFIGVTLFLVIAAAVWSNLTGFLIALGLGGTNAFVQAKNWRDTLTGFWRDKASLERSIRKLQMEYQLCTRNDNASQNRVECLIQEYFNKLDEAREKT
ncbi:MAG TPA: hypothetical protein VI864_06755 [Candidatus Bathyarchaeia archaeon]|nr:hypothetical protein [Candidatus Bathyarchaeia archaeon]